MEDEGEKNLKGKVQETETCCIIFIVYGSTYTW